MIYISFTTLQSWNTIVINLFYNKKRETKYIYFINFFGMVTNNIYFFLTGKYNGETQYFISQN